MKNDLIKFVTTGDCQRLKDLLIKNADPDTKDQQNTLLHLTILSLKDKAISLEQAKAVITLLLNFNANGRVKDSEGNTPAILAARELPVSQCETIINVLKDYGAVDINVKNNDGMNYLNYLNNKKLRQAAFEGKADEVEKLLKTPDSNINPNAQGPKTGNTALHEVINGLAKNKDLDAALRIIRLLCEHQGNAANVDISNNEPQTPIGLAKQKLTGELLETVQAKLEKYRIPTSELTSQMKELRM